MPFGTTVEGLRELRNATRELLPELDLTQVIRSFGAVRPNPHCDTGESIHDFCIDNPARGFYSLIGIKTPGLTCDNELGLHLAKKAARYLNAEENSDFNPVRRVKPAEDYEIICQCQSITRGQILDAIARGATTVDGVKRRVGAGMGRCQGMRCRREIERMLEDAKYGKL